MTGWSLFTVLVGGLATLAIFSFLIKENPLYRFFEHLFIGISAGLGTVLAIRNFLWPEILMPLLGLDITVYPDGTASKPYNPAVLLYLVSICFGLFYYFSFSRRYAWLSKLVIGFSLGMSGGIAFKGFFNEWLPQISSSMKPLLVYQCGEGAGCAFQWGQSLENMVFAVTLLSVMYYFFFSFDRHGKIGERFAYTGRWLMMVCFGAFFGSTVMARMALLVERVQFLLNDWRAAVFQVLGIG